MIALSSLHSENWTIVKEFDRGTEVVHTRELDRDVGYSVRLNSNLKVELEDAVYGLSISTDHQRLISQVLTTNENNLSDGFVIICVRSSFLVNDVHLKLEILTGSDL